MEKQEARPCSFLLWVWYVRHSSVCSAAWVAALLTWEVSREAGWMQFLSRHLAGEKKKNNWKTVEKVPGSEGWVRCEWGGVCKEPLTGHPTAWAQTLREYLPHLVPEGFPKILAAFLTRHFQIKPSVYTRETGFQLHCTMLSKTSTP